MPVVAAIGRSTMPTAGGAKWLTTAGVKKGG
jgi:hypothetical protein